MIPFLKNLLWNETIGERLIRAGMIAFSIYGQSRGWFPPEIAALIAGGGVFIPAGEKNPK